MIKLLVVACLGIFGRSSYAQQVLHEKEKTLKQIPEIVKKIFKDEFSGANKVSWTQEGVAYEASFKLFETKMSAVYDKSGIRKQIEIAIAQNELPAVTLQYIELQYSDVKFIEFAKMENSLGVVLYEVEVKNKRDHFDLIFDSQGKFLEQTE